MRDDAPFGGTSPPAAIFHYTRDRGGIHPHEHLSAWSGVVQADAYGGYNELYKPERSPAPILEARCWAHARRKFFELADIETAELKKARGEKPGVVYTKALEAVRLIDALFAIERQGNGGVADERLAVRQAQSTPIVAELDAWMDQAPHPARQQP